MEVGYPFFQFFIRLRKEKRLERRREGKTEQNIGKIIQNRQRVGGNTVAVGGGLKKKENREK